MLKNVVTRKKRRAIILEGISQDLTHSEISAQLGANRLVITNDIKLMRHNGDLGLKQAEKAQVQVREKKVSMHVCPECECPEMVRDHSRGELVCRSCGFVVVEDELDRGPEWNAYTFEQRRNLPRAGAPLTLTMHDKGLSTNIGKGKDYSGRRIKSGIKYKFYRLRKWNRRSKYSDSKHRNLSQALSHIGRIGNRLNLPRNVLETASKIYREALKKDLIRGRTIEVMAVTCLYMACRQCHVVRRFDEISEKSDIHAKKLARNYRYLFWSLDTDVPKSEISGIISRLVNKLGLMGETERLASKILGQAEDNMLTGGRGPAGMAAACIYIACQIMGERVTQTEIANLSGVTEVTIRNRYKELIEKLDIYTVL